MNIDALRQRLEQSRAELIAALQGVTERDFATEIGDGVTVVARLAMLAPAEREAVRDARRAVGAPDRPLPSAGASASTRVTPPQVVHDLAGARYETLLFLDELRSMETAPSPAVLTQVEAALAAICDREGDVAAQVRARPPAESPSRA